MDTPNLPQHVVIVPDGNRRWAKKKGKASYMGHKAGAEGMEKILKTALELKIPNLTIWGSSAANITDRSPIEVKFLLKIFELYFKKLAKRKEIHENEVRVRVIGRWEELFPEGAKRAIKDAIKATEKYSRHNLTFLMAYSGTDEMAHAIRGVVEAAKKDPDLAVNEKTIKENLWTRDLPPVDLVIRTAGEPHWSAGLMMWDVAEARLHFSRTLWPDFSPAEFKRILNSVARQERRFGK